MFMVMSVVNVYGNVYGKCYFIVGSFLLSQNVLDG